MKRVDYLPVHRRGKKQPGHLYLRAFFSFPFSRLRFQTGRMVYKEITAVVLSTGKEN